MGVSAIGCPDYSCCVSPIKPIGFSTEITIIQEIDNPVICIACNVGCVWQQGGGTATFGGSHGFEGWGHTDVEEATCMVSIAMEAGLNMFDTADVYSHGWSEEILGKAVKGFPREKLLIASKGGFMMSDSVEEGGAFSTCKRQVAFIRVQQLSIMTSATTVGQMILASLRQRLKSR